MAPGFKEECIWEMAAIAALERRNARAAFAASVSHLVSRDWIMRNIFHFTDDEIRALGAA